VRYFRSDARACSEHNGPVTAIAWSLVGLMAALSASSQRRSTICARRCTR